jgi:Family of unknown function (DUF5681)
MAQFKKGESGNPAGRPPGARHKTTVALEALLDGQAQRLTQKAIEMGMAGDMVALRVCLDRILPPRKDRPVRFPLPPITSAAEAAEASARILAAVSAGQLSPSEGVEINRLVETYIKALEVSELENRVARLEGRSVTVIS